MIQTFPLKLLQEILCLTYNAWEVAGYAVMISKMAFCEWLKVVASDYILIKKGK